MKQVEPAVIESQVDLLRNRDEQALKQVYRQNYSIIVNLVINNGGSLQEAKDIYQEAIIILYEKLQDESFELTCRIKTFLYSVSRNLWLKELKARNRFVNLAENEEHVDLPWETVFETEEKYAAMNSALNEMGEPCRSILQDYYMHNNSMEEIAEKFGYTNSDNAKNQKYKCLQRLKKLFFSYNKGD